MADEGRRYAAKAKHTFKTDGNNVAFEADADGINVDQIDELTSANGVSIDGVTLKDGAVTGNLTGNVTGDITGDITTDSISEETSGAGVSIDGLLVKDGVIYRAQGAPTAETGAATITAADLLTGIITITHSTGSGIALTVDTGTAMDTALATVVGTGEGFEWSVINLSSALADVATVTAASGHTLVGSGLIESAHADSEFPSSGRFFSRRTAANTWITYRIG